jgi:hypothetical protein
MAKVIYTASSLYAPESFTVNTKDAYYVLSSRQEVEISDSDVKLILESNPVFKSAVDSNVIILKGYQEKLPEPTPVPNPTNPELPPQPPKPATTEKTAVVDPTTGLPIPALLDTSEAQPKEVISKDSTTGITSKKTTTTTAK